MFDRITISHVPASRSARIAFSMLKPVGWKTFDSEKDWLAFAPKWRRNAGFLIIMRHREDAGAERLLTGVEGLNHYVQRTCPDLEPIAMKPEGDDFCPYDLLHFHGRIEGVPGRFIIGGTAMEIEDVHFALLGFAHDEIFHTMRATYQSMVSSFQPMVLPF